MRGSLRDLMSGCQPGILPAALRSGLKLASLGYQLGINARNRRFDRGLNVHRATVPVVSVGNLTAGGTGKTPVVAFIANYFRSIGVRPALLSRGYRSLGHGNDEALVLERLCPGVPHLQHPDRVTIAHVAVAEQRAELLILDDGFQHRRLARDLDIVLIDATNPFGYGHLLPRGLLREPMASLARADLILLTRVDAVSAERVQEIIAAIQKHASAKPIIEVMFPPAALVNASGNRCALDELFEVPTLGFCGIGNPQAFGSTLSAAGIRHSEIIPFPDHHHYKPSHLTQISRHAHAYGVGAVVTTLKDLVKVQKDSLPPPSNLPIWAIEIDCRIVSHEVHFLSALNALVSSIARRRAA